LFARLAPLEKVARPLLERVPLTAVLPLRFIPDGPKSVMAPAALLPEAPIHMYARLAELEAVGDSDKIKPVLAVLP
jgi:hypothetical protein